MASHLYLGNYCKHTLAVANIHARLQNMPSRVNSHCHSWQYSPYRFLQSVLPKQKSIQVISFLLHEHICVELLALQWHMTNSTIASRAATVLVVCDLCRPGCSHVWVGRTGVVTWLSLGTKLYNVLANVRYAPQRHPLLEATCYFLPDVFKADSIRG